MSNTPIFSGRYHDDSTFSAIGSGRTMGMILFVISMIVAILTSIWFIILAIGIHNEKSKAKASKSYLAFMACPIVCWIAVLYFAAVRFGADVSPFKNAGYGLVSAIFIILMLLSIGFLGWMTHIYMTGR